MPINRQKVTLLLLKTAQIDDKNRPFREGFDIFEGVFIKDRRGRALLIPNDLGNFLYV